LAEAEALYRQILVIDPRHADALHLLGLLAHRAGRSDVAVELIRQAIALKPNSAETHSNLGIALKDQGQLDQAIALKPDFTEAYYNLANALKETGQLDDSIAEYRQAIALEPDLPEAHSNLGNALRDKGQLDAAIAACRQAIALKPDLPEAHVNLAFVMLVQGDFLRGWEEYDWLWKVKDAASPQRNFTQPQWDGRPLEGRTLLLHAEQGFGDAIRFIRYLPRVARRGGNIILECQPELHRLFRTMAPDLQVVAKGQTLPAFDLHCPLLSLPRAFSTDLGKIPRTVPYLHANAAEAALWRERIAGPGSSISPSGSDRPSGPDLKVGLVWAGNPAHTNDRNRSLKLASLAPLAEVPGVRFFSLQKGPATAEAKAVLASFDWIDAAEDLKDFADTAALLANLDLVIAADTAVVHLAGAMGRPVWTLLPFAPDWRWLLGRSDSPWYPTMRLFRQSSIGDWASVIAEVREQLQVLVHSRGE